MRGGLGGALTLVDHGELRGLVVQPTPAEPLLLPAGEDGGPAGGGRQREKGAGGTRVSARM